MSHSAVLDITPPTPLPPKRPKPPRINLSLAAEKRGPPIILETESPVVILPSDSAVEETLQLSSPDTSPLPSPTLPSLGVVSSADGISDDIVKDLAELERLRKNLQQNLRLRPIKSRSALPKVDLNSLDSSPPPLIASGSPYSPPAVSWRNGEPQSAVSPTSSIESFFTPTAETPSSAQFVGSSSTRNPALSPLRPLAAAHSARSISPKALYDRLLSPARPLLIDTRLPTAHLAFHVKHSINITIPSLILKRCRKPGGGFQTLDALRQFITTENGKEAWDELMRPGGSWDGDVIVYDDEMNVKDRDNVGVTAWALIPVLAPLLSYGTVDYLEGGISGAGHNPDLETLIVSGDESDLKYGANELVAQPAAGAKKGGGGLFQLDTQTAFRSKPLPELEPSSSTASNPPTPPARSPLPMMSSVMPSSTSSAPTVLRSTDPNNMHIEDSSPSPPPSTIGFRRPPPPRRPSLPSLRKIDTRSTEKLNLNTNLPKLSLRTKPMRSATLTIPPSLPFSQAPTSPSHLTLAYSSHSPPASSLWTPTSPNVNDPSNYLTPYYTPPHTPGTPKQQFQLQPPSPSTPYTARPEHEPLSTETEEGAFPAFTVSTILPNFLYLGPELTEPGHVEELQELGVKRILNIAAECDDDHGLKLKEVFERYVKIPMRDTVEEENIAKGMGEVCEILDDARLHSAPTYVHCKAGKSRSVTAVMAYLIHANHWTLSRAYSFVFERRKGISPNIGFVSELMSFEEQELGGKSVGVQPSAPAGTSQVDGAGSAGASGGDFGVAVGSGNPHRRGGHVRESLPPALMTGLEGMGGGAAGGPMSAGGLMERVMGDSGQEMEIKDKEGRYRHARRAPVDENTLQPLRRVSKAGLESSAYA